VPDGVDTPLAVVFLIVPGFLLRAAFIRSRAHGAPTTDLYALAEAVVASLFVLAIAWWWRGEDLVTWADTKTLRDHRTSEYYFLAALLLVPYPAGLSLGWGLNGLALAWRKSRDKLVVDENWAYKLYRLIDKSGLVDGPTLWDDIWEEMNASVGSYYVRIRMKSGQEIVGGFDKGSWASMSPHPRELYLGKVYKHDAVTNAWKEVPNTLGVLIDATDVESIEYVREA
jgi:Family of unknown function (DUF6338)